MPNKHNLDSSIYALSFTLRGRLADTTEHKNGCLSEKSITFLLNTFNPSLSHSLYNNHKACWWTKYLHDHRSLHPECLPRRGRYRGCRRTGEVEHQWGKPKLFHFLGQISFPLCTGLSFTYFCFYKKFQVQKGTRPFT